MSDSILREKSFLFAVKIVRFCRKMMDVNKEYIISAQLLSSGTGPGAMSREAQYAECRSDFRHKLNIGLKEANEAVYWLDLIAETFPVLREEALILRSDGKEILSMLVSSTKTLKSKP